MFGVAYRGFSSYLREGQQDNSDYIYEREREFTINDFVTDNIAECSGERRLCIYCILRSCHHGKTDCAEVAVHRYFTVESAAGELKSDLTILCRHCCNGQEER